jgi:hypothetical protein
MITRAVVIRHLGGCCKRCGEDDIRCLTIDHVFSDGWKERKILPAGSQKFYKVVLADTHGRYQCLCSNCQSIKAVERSERKPAWNKKPISPKTVRLVLRIKKKLEERIC